MASARVSVIGFLRRSHLESPRPVEFVDNKLPGPLLWRSLAHRLVQLHFSPPGNTQCRFFSEHKRVGFGSARLPRP